MIIIRRRENFSFGHDSRHFRYVVVVTGHCAFFLMMLLLLVLLLSLSLSLFSIVMLSVCTFLPVAIAVDAVVVVSFE